MKKHIITSLLLILTTSAFAAPGSSGAMNMGGSGTNATCDEKPIKQETTCPTTPQLKLSASQSLTDNEFVYASESVYKALKAKYDKRTYGCRTYFSINSGSDIYNNGVYECDNSYCGKRKVIILESGHVFMGDTITSRRAYICDTDVDDRWHPYTPTITYCNDYTLNNKNYTEFTQGKTKYRFITNNQRQIQSLCQVPTEEELKKIQQKTQSTDQTNTGSTPAKTGTPTQTTTPVQTSPQAGDSCTMANAKTAKYKKVGNDLKCIAIECNTNYYLVENSNIQQKDGTCVAKTYCGENKELKIIAGNKTDLTCTDKQVTNSDNDTPDSSSETPVNTSNDPKVGDTCSSNGAQTATYKKIGNEIKCVASTCKSNFYLVVNANGNSQGWCTAKISCPENKEMKIIDGTKTDRTCVDKVATTPDNEETTIEETVITPDNEEETVITPDNEDGTVATECTPDSTNPECDCPDDKIREVDNTCVDETALYKQAKAEMMNRHTQLTTQTEQLNNSEAQ